jgi:hypothetical protein
MFPEIMEAAILKTCWTMGPAIGEFHPCISPSCGRDCFRRQRERQSRRQPNPVALSSILNKWRSQMIVIDTDWNSILDVDVAVVLDDDETRALGKKRTKQQ